MNINTIRNSMVKKGSGVLPRIIKGYEAPGAAPAQGASPASQPSPSSQQPVTPAASAKSSGGGEGLWGRIINWRNEVPKRLSNIKKSVTDALTEQWLKNNWHKIALPALGLLGGLALGGKNSKLPWALAGGLGAYALANSQWGNSIRDWANSAWAGANKKPAPSSTTTQDPTENSTSPITATK